MPNRASVNVFDDKTKADAMLKELTDAKFDASIIGPLAGVAVNAHYGNGSDSFTTPKATNYYVVTGSNKSKA